MRRGASILAVIALTIALALWLWADRGTVRLVVSVPSLSISRLPYIIAQDQGLYAKYGLKVELWMAASESDERTIINADWLTQLWRAFGINTPNKPDVSTNGGTPLMLDAIENVRKSHEIVLASTDCVVRAHIVGRKGISGLDELKGKRIGVSGLIATPGFHALLLAQRMGWDSVQDVSILGNADNIDLLLDNSVDATVSLEREYAKAKRAGLPILADTRDWNEPIAGNSIRVDPEWLKDSSHRDAAERFIKATIEAIAIFHQQPEIAMQVMEKWYGITDRDYAKTLYDRGAWIPRKPYPCYDGFKATMKLYDSNEMRRHRPEEFYDDSIMKEIDATGFIDRLYQ